MPGVSSAEDILRFWFCPEPKTPEEALARMGHWYGGGSDLDDEIHRRFGALVERARRGELDDWARTPRGSLALIILIDQFSRNLYRGRAAAFSHDGKALQLARDGYDAAAFEGFGTLEHVFAAMPFCHAESLEDQRRGLHLATRNALRAPPHLLSAAQLNVDWGRKHLDVVARFGRFPHRNETLGRSSTPEEQEYLAYCKATGQWL